MKQQRTINDLSANLDGLAAMLTVLSVGFLEDEVTETNSTIGNALFGLADYAERIADDLQAIADGKGARK